MKWIKRLFARRSRRRVMVRQFDYQKFKQRLAAIPGDDPLWPLLLEFLDANVHTETSISVQAGLDDAEAHRFRGRIGMCMDLRSDLEKALREAKEQPLEQKP